MLKRQEKWDLRFLDLAKFVSNWSKDPSTKTGACITTTDNRIVSIGFNGFPIGVQDLPERLENREIKYKMIAHCECNAILFANRDISGCALYTWPFPSCSRCAVMAIQAGIKRHVAPEIPQSLYARWGKDIELALALYKEAGVNTKLY